MSQILRVLKNKGSLESARKASRQEKLNRLKMESAFRAKLNEDMALVDLVLQDEDVTSVTIEIDNRHITNFMRSIYTEEMAQYSIVQVNENTFNVARKLVAF